MTSIKLFRRHSVPVEYLLATAMLRWAAKELKRWPNYWRLRNYCEEYERTPTEELRKRIKIRVRLLEKFFPPKDDSELDSLERAHEILEGLG